MGIKLGGLFIIAPQFVFFYFYQRLSKSKWMITKEQAIDIANGYISEKNQGRKIILQLQLERTIEFELGWVFCYQSKDYIETGDTMKRVFGNAPIIINKQTGAIHVTGTRHTINTYIIRYFQQEERKQKGDSA